jgi:PAS domain S-box-containing protein
MPEEIVTENWQALALDSQDPLARILSLAEDAILSTDQDQRIILFNQGAERIFGYAAEETLGQTLDLLLPERYTRSHGEHMREFANGLQASRRMGERSEIFGRRKDGSEFPAEASISKVKLNGKWLFTAILRDVTDRKRTEKIIRNSLREKEALLKEIHHRVKNNLQVISSLLGLQSRSVEDEETRRVFQESQNRIYSMALLHEKLYQADNLSAVDCEEYVRQLATHLFRAYDVHSGRVKLAIEVEPAKLGMDTAVPFGLILNELLSNCLKHAFPDNREGEILIALQQQADGRTVLLVRDDGVGLDVDLSTTRTLGWRLVRTLAAQLEAVVEVRMDRGTEVELKFFQKKP